jgi:hypothetical protein
LNQNYDNPINHLRYNQKSGLIDYDPSKENTAFGYGNLNMNTNNGISAFGYQSLFENTTGYSNTAIGSSSLRYDVSA